MRFVSEEIELITLRIKEEFELLKATS